MKLILIGFMGSGKTTVGHLLAKKLGLELVEMDKLIVKKAGKSINQIFRDEGEAKFRQLETQIAKDLEKMENVVISTGGGVVTNKINIDNLRKNGKIIFLKTSFLEIKKRLTNVKDRPLFKNIESAKKLFDFRKKLYEQYTDLIVDTDEKSVEEITYEIISKN